MTFLNLGKRFQPARKAWKTFTSKFQRSKTITKKPKNRIKSSTRKSVFWPSLTFQRRLQLKGRRIQTTHIRHHDCLQRRSKPVYIDELFIEPASMAKPVYIDELFIEPASTAKGKGHIDITEKCSTSVEAGKLIGQSANDVPVADDVPGTSKAGMKGHEETDEADDMWESLELASPMMQGIDEKAEEFITRIRAEMQLQEMMARQL